LTLLDDVRAASSACAHLAVRYHPEEESDGLLHARWACELCGKTFLPVHLRAIAAAYDDENTRLANALATVTEALRVHCPRGLPTISDCTYDRKGTGAAGYAPHGCPENRSDSDPLWWCSPCRVRAALAKLEGSETKPPGHPPECRCDGCLKALAEKVRRA